MQTRPASPADVPALTELWRRWDTHWFGAPEHDESELREDLAPLSSLEEQTLLVHDEEELVGAAWWWGQHTVVLAAPVAERTEVIRLLLDAGEAADRRDAFALDRDTELVEALTARGWRYEHSAFDLVRAVAPDWTLPEPAWPDDVEVTGFDADEAATIHDLVYRRAAWTDVPGHVARTLEEWEALFLKGDVPPGEQVVARRGGRPVGVALSRSFSDGMGWVAQLAVDVAERGSGLGRALLLEAFTRRRAAGATKLGLAVQADNPRALGLYESIGLKVDREYRSFVRD